MARILDLDDTASRIGGLVHLDTQKADVGLDLTVASVQRLTGPGSLDFGGSELDAAERETMEAVLRDEDDDYGWWELEAGNYLVRYNEILDLERGEWAQVFPLERLLLAGAFHPAFIIDEPRDPLHALLQVGKVGCNLKENCRISRVVVLE